MARSATPILPGSTVGVLGSGQLGRMLAQVAARLGYRIHIFSPDANPPAGEVARRNIAAEYLDLDAVAEFARGVDVVTLEFENIPTQALEAASRHAPVRPSAGVLATVQDRLREKRFLRDAGLPCTPFAEVAVEKDLDAAIAQVGLPAVMKTAAWGYDGKGQALVKTRHEAADAWQRLERQPTILESLIDYRAEASVLTVRSPSGEVRSCGPIANDHVNHILDVSTFPADSLAAVADEAIAIAEAAAEKLAAIGLICVEFFVTADNKLLINEIAPRPHNSGHLTIEACCVSQFEQQLRAVCDLPLGDFSRQVPAAAMANLLGDLWSEGEPDWTAAMTDPRVRLHLYGKLDARVGRKMGHLTATADTVAEAEAAVRQCRARLVRRSG